MGTAPTLPRPSTKAAVAAARNAGANVFADTCPQYLYLNLEDHLGAPGFAGAGYVCSTPLRSKHEHHHQDLWRGLRTNQLSVVSTDHCPFCLKDQKALGRGNFSKIPNGIGTVEHRMDRMYQGVVAGELTLERWVELCSTTPARMFGLYGRKGVLAPGADADIVVYDPGASQTLGVATHHMHLDYSAYEGITVDGRVGTVISRGSVLVDGDGYHGNRFCILGPVEAHVDKLRALEALGVDQFALYLMHDQRDATLTAYGDLVMPALRICGKAESIYAAEDLGP